MARQEIIKKGVGRYTVWPTLNYGGTPLKIGFNAAYYDPNYIILKFDDEAINSIVGGMARKIELAICLEDYDLDATAQAKEKPYIEAYAIPLTGNKDISSLTQNDITPFFDVAFKLGKSKAITSYATGLYLYFELDVASAYYLFDGRQSSDFAIALRAYVDENSVNYTDIRANFTNFTNSNWDPEIVMEIENAYTWVSYVEPAGGFVDASKDSTFRWELAYQDVYFVGKPLSQLSAKFRWRKQGDSTYEEIMVPSSRMSYTVPANTFNGKNIEWQVEINSNASNFATSAWSQVTTIDAAAISNPLSPVNQKLNRDETNTFKWNHSTENGTAQTAADLQYSSDSLNWKSLATVTGSEQSVTVSAGKLPLGTVFWRVRTYNANGVAGAWSDPAIITVVGAVPAPSISSITGNAMPVIKWSAQIQQAFQVQIQNESGIMFDSGAQLGTAKTYSIGTLLPDGQYTARVRVYADNGTASDWASSPFAISTTKPSAPSISVQSGVGQVIISVVADSTDAVYILRDGVPIGTARNGVFTDYSSAGRSRYIARAVSGDNRYADSTPVTAEPIIRGSIIAAADDLSKSVSLMLNLGGMPTREFNWAPMGGIAHYAGRKYPDYQYTEQEEESYNFSFAFRTKEEFDSFMQLCKKRGTVLYRDQYGLKFYGVITGVSPNVQWAGWAVTFSMTRVEYSEAVSYA